MSVVHGTASDVHVDGAYVEMQLLVLRALPRTFDSSVFERWKNDGEKLTEVLKNALLPKPFRRPEVDWNACAAVILQNFFSARSAREIFLKDHPEWECEVEPLSHPPRISMEFWLKPQKNSLRSVTGGPERPHFAKLKSEEIDLLATFVGIEVTEQVGFKAKREKDPIGGAGVLQYYLQPDYSAYER
jgi:hypothetical protein